jgi:hypothetical protein
MSEIQREPLSGTYNAFEFQVVHARDGNSSDYQEMNGPVSIAPAPVLCFVPPAPFVPCTNPMFINSGSNSFRYRATSTAEMVQAVNGTTPFPTVNPDRLGYAFYGLQTFYIPASHLKYLKLQGLDPLYPMYSINNGLFGTCIGAINTASLKCTTTLPSFDRVIDGDYRVWSVLRAVVNTAPPFPPALVQTLIQSTQDHQAFALLNPGLSGIGAPNTLIQSFADFVPTFYYPGGGQVQFFKMFRSHYGISGVDANNGTNLPTTFCAADQVAPNCFEEGGDMAGVGYQIISDQIYFNITGSEVLTHIE